MLDQHIVTLHSFMYVDYISTAGSSLQACYNLLQQSIELTGALCHGGLDMPDANQTQSMNTITTTQTTIRHVASTPRNWNG
jgi:hypothetical protein